MQPSHTLSTIDAAEFNELIELTTRNVCIAFNVNAFYLATVSDNIVEYLEGAALYSFADIFQLHAKAQIRFVAAETIHSIVPGQTLERNLDVLAQRTLEDVVDQAFHELQNLVNLHEGHFHVQLGEFRLTVSTQVLITEAACNLEVTLHASYHEQLLEDLRRLRQCIELAGVYTARNEVVTSALRSGFAQHRSFDFQEMVLVKVVAHELSYFMTQNQVILHFRTTQVQITIFQTQVFVSVNTVFDIERRSFCTVQHFDIMCQHFNSTSRDIFVDGFFITQTNITNYLDNILVTDVFGSFEAAACTVRVSNNLHNTAAVTQVNKNQSAMVTAFCNPAAQYNLLAGLLLAQHTTMMAAFFVNHV